MIFNYLHSIQRRYYNIKYVEISFLFLLISLQSFSQQLYYPLHADYQQIINKENTEKKLPVHTSFKPILFYKDSLTNFDSVCYTNKNRNRINNSKNWFVRKLFSENFISINKDNITLIINPLLNVEYGKNLINDSICTINTRGIEIKGNLGNKVSYYSSFFENQAYYVDYVDNYIRKQVSVPAQGTPKPFPGFTGRGYDFASSSGYVSIELSRFLHVSFGHSRHFIGNGYRSLFLSDNSFHYPFLQLTWRYKTLQYNMLYAAFQNYEHFYYHYHTRKHATINYVSWKPKHWLEMGLFEAILWKTSDSTSNRRFNPQFLNPIIFSRLATLGLNNENNMLIGLQSKINLTSKIHIYNQLLIDNYDINKTFKNTFENRIAYQIGINYFDFLGVKYLYFQSEWNVAKPYTYTHSNEYQSFTHQNLPLAHPLGTGFKEWYNTVNYKIFNFMVEIKYSNAVMSSDTLNTNFGSNIFLSNSSAMPLEMSVGQGVRTSINHKTIRLNYLLNPNTNLRIFVGFDNRVYKNDLQTKTTNYLSFGIQTAIQNIYFDF